ncbi:MAG: hypothetical protein ABID54_04880 [Pseudomonadota bacterium]
MGRLLTVVIALILVVSLPAYAQHFEVVEVLINPEGAVLRDMDTGQQWVAEVGDEINGWQVVKITEDYVTISKRMEGLPMLMTEIPVDKTKRIISVSPKIDGQ